MDPHAMRRTQHQYTIAYIRNHLRFARLLRIDHVMGLHRLYCIPDGQSGEKGVYVEYPADELYAILSLEAQRHRAGIVGENLGTVPTIVNRSMVRHGIHRMFVVQYEIAGDPAKAALNKPVRQSIASLNTHDMPPFRAFWDLSDIDDRVDLNFLTEKAARAERRQRTRLKEALVGYLRRRKFLQNSRVTAESVFQALMAFLSSSHANIVLVNLEDTWQETEPQNVPATHRERPNWTRRFRHSIEEMQQMPEVVETLRTVSALRKSQKRGL
jgi:4-alpha-glucanotransferase